MSPFKALRLALVPAAILALASACNEPPADLGKLGGPTKGEDDVVSGGKKKKDPAPKTEPTDTPAPEGDKPPPATPQQDQAPTLASVTPEAVTVGQSPNGVELTLEGTRFAFGAQVDIGGTKLPANVISASQLKVQIPADKVKQVGAVRLAVVAKPGVESNALSFTVANPTTVTIATLAPNNVVLGLQNADVPLTITGSGYTQASVVRFNGAALPTTFTSSTSLKATIPSIAFIATGRFGVTVATGNDIISLPSPFEVRNPKPATTTLAPATATAGDGATVVTVSGSKFTKASEVLVGNTALATTYVSATQLRATVPSTLLKNVATLSLVVTTGAPGGGSSTALTLSVKAGQSTTQGAQCAYKCADYGYKAFTCYSNWYCIGTGTNAGCLAQTACTDTVTDTGNPNETTGGGTTAACKYKCTDYKYSPGECDQGYYCRYSDGCLVADDTCATAASSTGSTTTNACKYACADYGYKKGECDGGYYCQYADGCLVADSTCKTAATSTGSSGSSGTASKCQYDCDSYNYAPGDCSGGYYCQYADNCLVADDTCY